MMKDMKPAPKEMIEGPEAFQRFREGLKVALSVPKRAIIQDERTHSKKKQPAAPKD